MVQKPGGGNIEKEGEVAEELFYGGTHLVTTGRYLEAIQAFEKALEIRPREAWYLAGLAAAVDRLGFLSTLSVLPDRQPKRLRSHPMPGS